MQQFLSTETANTGLPIVVKLASCGDLISANPTN
jgi:hypothetical protein